MAERYLYTITCALDGMIYVGCTKNPRRRWNEHVGLSKKFLTNNPLHEAMRHYGKKAFILEVVGTHASAEAAKVAEAALIAELDSLWPNGYNLNSEQGAGAAHHALTKTRISEKNKGRPAHENTIVAGYKTHHGVPKSEDHKAKISAALIGKPKSEEAKAKMSTAAKRRVVDSARTEKGTFACLKI